MKHFTCLLVLSGTIIVHICESLKYKQNHQRKASSRKYSLTALEQFISALSSSDGEFKEIFAPVLVKLHNLESQNLVKSKAGKNNTHLDGKTQGKPRKKPPPTSEKLIRRKKNRDSRIHKKSNMSEDQRQRNIYKASTASNHHSQRYRERTNLTTETVQSQNISNQTGFHSSGQYPLNITPSLSTSMKVETFILIQGSINLSGSERLMHRESVSSIMGFNRTISTNSLVTENATLQRKFHATLLLSKFDPLKSEEQTLKLTGVKTGPRKSVIDGNASQQGIVTVRPSASFIGKKKITTSEINYSNILDISHNVLKVPQMAKYPIQTETMIGYLPTSTPSPQNNFHLNTNPNPSLPITRTTVSPSRQTDQMSHETESHLSGEDYRVPFAPELDPHHPPELDPHHPVLPMTKDSDSFRVMRTLLLLLGAFVAISFTLCILYLWFRTCSFYKLYDKFLKKEGYQKVEKLEEM